MFERPITCDTVAVQALRAGTKTMMRLEVEPQPQAKRYPGDPADYWSWTSPIPTPGYKGRFGLGVWDDLAAFLQEMEKGCPWGQPGDQLWVQEAWGQLTFGTRVYQADGGWIEGAIDWKPASAMPRDASRILLEIVAVRVERLLDISEADALAEGVQLVKVPTSYRGPAGSRQYYDVTKYTNYAGRKYCDGINLHSAKESYESLCASLHGSAWVVNNPFVWVLEVKLVSLQSMVCAKAAPPE